MVTLKFDRKVECGPEFVALRILENCDQLRVGSIWLPDMTGENARLAHCVVENCGGKASDEYGIRAGDYVMIDRLSTFAHTAPVCLCRYNNVICLTNADRTEFRPLKDMVFVEPDQKDPVAKVDNVYVPGSYDDKLNIGTVTAVNVSDPEYRFSVGDRVLVTKGADIMELGEKKTYIYKKDMLICRILEEEKE